MTDKTSKSQMPNETTIAAMVAAKTGETTGHFGTVAEMMEELNSVGGDQEEMDYHIQRLGPDISALLYGCDGMLFAADQYCESRDQLELSDYIEWMVCHYVKVRLYVRNQVKGILYRRQVRQIVESSNDRIRELGSLLAVDERSPEMIELLAMVKE